jgi:hypothetical protein
MANLSKNGIFQAEKSFLEQKYSSRVEFCLKKVKFDHENEIRPNSTIKFVKLKIE